MLMYRVYLKQKLKREGSKRGMLSPSRGVRRGWGPEHGGRDWALSALVVNLGHWVQF